MNLRAPEYGDSTFSETLVQNSATWYKVSEDIFNQYRHESLPEDSVPRTSIVSLYGEVLQNIGSK
jgi:hypothetical protein